MSGTIPQLISFSVVDDVRAEADGKFTLVGVYLDVNLQRDPRDQEKPITAVAIIRGLTEGEHSYFLEITHPEKRLKMKTPVEVCKSVGEEAIMLLIMEMDGFFFPAPGEMEFRLFVNDEQLGTYNLRVNFPLEISEEPILTRGSDSPAPKLPKPKKSKADASSSKSQRSKRPKKAALKNSSPS